MTVTLLNVIAVVESNDFVSAVRYEPTKYGSTRWSALNLKVSQINKCSRDTAEIILSSSWGKYQIMGSNLYGLIGIDYPIGVYLNSVIDQDATVSSFLDKNYIHYVIEDMINDPHKMLDFVTKYNGPGNVSNYTALITSAYNTLNNGDVI